MSCEKTHTVHVTDLSKGQLWKVWEDVNNWHFWDSDIEFAKLASPFAAGSVFRLKPRGAPEVRIELLRVEPPNAFTDVTRFPLARMYGIHEMKESADGLEVKHTVRIEGPLSFLWRKLVAEKIAAGLKNQAEKMLQRAREVRNDDR